MARKAEFIWVWVLWHLELCYPPMVFDSAETAKEAFTLAPSDGVWHRTSMDGGGFRAGPWRLSRHVFVGGRSRYTEKDKQPSTRSR